MKPPRLEIAPRILEVTNTLRTAAATCGCYTIGTQNIGNPLMVQSHEAADAAVRPVLLLDYAASCEGDQCVEIEREL